MGSSGDSAWGNAWEAVGVVVLEGQAMLGPSLDSAREARRLLRDFLDDAGRVAWAHSGELAISEVATNAALRARTGIELRLIGSEAKC